MSISQDLHLAPVISSIARDPCFNRAVFSRVNRTRSAEKIWKALIGYATTRLAGRPRGRDDAATLRRDPGANLYAALVAGDAKVLGESQFVEFWLSARRYS